MKKPQLTSDEKKLVDIYKSRFMEYVNIIRKETDLRYTTDLFIILFGGKLTKCMCDYYNRTTKECVKEEVYCVEFMQRKFRTYASINSIRFVRLLRRHNTYVYEHSDDITYKKFICTYAPYIMPQIKKAVTRLL